MGYSRSRAKCLQLQYPPTATRGEKQSLNKNQLQNENLILGSLPLQGKENLKLKAINSPTENKMYYELSNKKHMECEKYQDCSWFQNPLKPDCNGKLSPVESFDFFNDANEFDLSMQYGNAEVNLWGGEYMEVFSDDIPLKENYLLENKNYISNDNIYSNYKGDEDAFDSINFGLKKTDSIDCMKSFVSTNPADIIPISYKEKINSVRLGDVKYIKHEELDQNESNNYVIESDDSDLIIGREEEIDSGDNGSTVSSSGVSVDHIKCETDNVSAKQDNNDNLLPIKIENESRTQGKLDMNLDIPKISFEQPMQMSTPDLDFMDLVNFINEEMREESTTPVNSSLTNTVSPAANTNINVTDIKEQGNESNNKPSDIVPSPAPQVENSTVNFSEVTGTGVSIAERIKTSAKRRTKKTLKDFIETEDEESSDSFDEDADDDDDYDYREDLAKRRCVQTKRRTFSLMSDSSGDGRRVKDESSSYRERRDKNNEASRRSRQNRKARERQMYESLEEEEKRNVKLKAEADVLEKQVTSLRQLLLQVVLRKGSGT